ncbi:ribosomal protein S18-alanine N-acetyltransferase [Pimelobacter simplex]|uniref:ribosomal protein S18-alanine N-acetyltransferase n=1 Tax=Nocardioides simplex TaxID=2045 RepID=UPI00214FDEA9|nr:ribosomal protein S18-alanine N-acetyltransferase [Pimelobacter simplex]UUW92195.1 ribosomal protein S18-alanine N-acetyltransferase [Pimelobacter simplex]UUW96021.1 ribosomal protein S18-alanine N-acetyltransferase [Pimelobacter simplex]
MNIGPAGVDDIAEIAALEAEAFPLDPWSPNLLREAVGGLVPTMALLVARSSADGGAANFAGYAVVSVVDVDAELQRIAVPEERRRSGVAGALLAATHAVAGERGATRLLLEVREDNIIARTFYERHGFAELGRRPRYYRDGTTALVLSTPVTMDP